MRTVTRVPAPGEESIVKVPRSSARPSRIPPTPAPPLDLDPPAVADRPQAVLQRLGQSAFAGSGRAKLAQQGLHFHAGLAVVISRLQPLCTRGRQILIHQNQTP